jgi:hypothetical protein
MAAILGTSKSWLEKEFQANEESQHLYQHARAEMRSSLRTYQLRAAQAGNATMLIWLGKNELGQRDYRALEVSGPQGGPLEVSGDLKPLLEQKLRQFLRSKQNRQAVREAVGEEEETG